VEKYCGAGQPPDDNMARVHRVLYTEGYKHTLRICNTFCFPTATRILRTRINATLYVHCLS